MTSFSDFGLHHLLLKALHEKKYTAPTPIQMQAIPPALEGRDILGLAQTGTGKTAAFLLPILHHLLANKAKPNPKESHVLVLTPTRELAVQIGQSLAAYSTFVRLKRIVLFGGVSLAPQVRDLARGVDILIATPGRLLDHVRQGTFRLGGTQYVVLDEADRMLDMGFAPDIKKIFADLPQERQTLLFSATMPREVEDLVQRYLHEGVRVEIAPQATTAQNIEQKVLFVRQANKRNLLESLFEGRNVQRAIIFARTKHGANRIAEHLSEGGIKADALHGGKSQGARQKALDLFRKGRLRALVATDIAARGIDVTGVTHVINFDLPNEPESYVHRIGRTARAGAGGVALSFCNTEEVAYLRSIEKTIRQSVPIESQHDFHDAETETLHTSGVRVFPPKRSGGRGSGPSGRRGDSATHSKRRSSPQGHGQNHGKFEGYGKPRQHRSDRSGKPSAGGASEASKPGKRVDGRWSEGRPERDRGPSATRPRRFSKPNFGKGDGPARPFSRGRRPSA